MTALPPLTYLSFDEISRGVGASQVLPYVERLAARGVDVTLHSFEHSPPTPALAARLVQAGVTWRVHEFGRSGAVGGLARIARGARAVRGAELVHARSDLAAASAMLARSRSWIWDVRSFWADQRIELGMLRAGSPEDRLLRMIERRAAASCDGLVTLAGAAVPILEARHGIRLTTNRAVVPTCVDLEAFALRPPPPPSPLRVMLSGSLNCYYDVPAMLRLHAAIASRRPSELLLVAPGATSWDAALDAAGAARRSATPDEMPGVVADSHVGLSVCRLDVGDSLAAAVPTKIAEFLATGRPVVVNAGLGDMDEIVAEHRCGVVLRGTGDDDVAAAAAAVLELLDDPDLAMRCRQAAEARFDLDRGVDRLLEVYRIAYR